MSVNAVLYAALYAALYTALYVLKKILGNIMLWWRLDRQPKNNKKRKEKIVQIIAGREMRFTLL